MKPPLLINSVLPSKIFTIYSAEWKEITDFPADTAAQALEGAQKMYGAVCRSAVVKNKITQDYARNTPSPPSSASRATRVRFTPAHGSPAPYTSAGTRRARGLAAIGATVSSTPSDRNFRHPRRRA
jgi:hypothetical protein